MLFSFASSLIGWILYNIFHQYAGGFGTALMQKDLGLAGDAAKTVNAPLPLGGTAYNIYNILNNSGLGKKDFGVIYQYLSGDSEGQGEKS